MKPRYRIISSEKLYGDGRTKVRYTIQKRFWFIWLEVIFQCHYYTHHTSWAMITGRRFSFITYNQAKEVISCLQKPRTIKYKGYLIKRIFEDHTLKEQFITNFKKKPFYDNDMSYYFSETIDHLKSFIDEGVFTTKKRIHNYTTS